MNSRHALSRYAERYGATMTSAELIVLERRLGAGEGMLLSRSPTGDETQVIWHSGSPIVAVYSTTTGQVKTFLPPDAAFVAGSRRARLRAR